MVTFNIIERVFMFKNSEDLATAFTFDIDHRRFIVTAKHAVNNIMQPTKIEIFRNGNWSYVDVDLVEHAPGNIDISVLTAKEAITVNHELTEAKQFYYGEDVYFLGYPYGEYADYHRIGLELPMPIIKKAIISLVQTSNDETMILLDGHNNKGFSGAPIVKPNNIDRRKMELIGVVSGYKYWNEPVFDQAGKVTHSYQENTGIIISYQFRHARDIMLNNINKGYEIAP